MQKFLIFASVLAVATSFPSIIGDHGEATLSLGGGGGFGGEYIGGGNSYAVSESGHDSTGSESGTIGGDFHHGVSIVGTGGGEHKSTVFDLTNQGGGDHQGAFGGSFVASSKYSAGGHGGDVSNGGLGGYGVSEHLGTGFAEHYSDILGASYGGNEALTSDSLGTSHE